jgi:proteasome lid subunit RPN8/RPN11
MTIKFTDVSPAIELPVWSSFNATTVIDVDTLAYSQVLAHIQQHSIEQGGLLIGRAWSNPNVDGETKNAIARVEILQAIAATHSDATEFSLRMGAQVWVQANEKIAQLAQPELRIIGWFHSHPNLGAFFSATDRATQAAFFNHPYSVGWVIDPFTDDLMKHQAFFIGANSEFVSSK